MSNSEGKIVCADCVDRLKMADTKHNEAIDKIIGGLNIKCPNIRRASGDGDDDDEKSGDAQCQCVWRGTIAEWKQHAAECPVVAETVATCSQCDSTDIKLSELEEHRQNECTERLVPCKYEGDGCDAERMKTMDLDQHYKEQAMHHLELRVQSLDRSLRAEVERLEATVSGQQKDIELLKHKNSRLQMQLHTKRNSSGDFLIVFESSQSKTSFVSSLNLEHHSMTHSVVKPLERHKKRPVIFKRVKDCAYAVASNVTIDRVIGITAKAKAQHIASCVGTLSHCVCTFNALYRVGGDTLDVEENNNICNILGTDVVFALPQLQCPRFNHRIVYSKSHGILAVGGEPIKKGDAKRELKEIQQEAQGKRAKDRKEKTRKAILGSVEQLNLAPMDALKNYYQIRNFGQREEEKLAMPPEPELKWRNLGAPMKYRRDCPSVGIWHSAHSENLFVAGGWNEKDLSSVETYDFKKREWRQLSSLNVKRNSAGICEWKTKSNNMVIVGGWNRKTTHSVEEYDAHKNQWYLLKNTNHPHKYYPACTVYHDLNPFINTGHGVIVVMGNDGRLYGDDYLRKEMQRRMSEKEVAPQKEVALNRKSSSGSVDLAAASIKKDWGFIEFYDPRDWIRKWQVIDSLPSFLNISELQAKELYFQAALSCDNQFNVTSHTN